MSYFTDDELKCKSTGVLKLAPGFLNRLNELREAWGRPMIVNSCCRSAEYNRQVDGKPDSWHIYDHSDRDGTCAIDIKMIDSEKRGLLVSLAWEKGWTVGVAKTFLHLDRRVDFGRRQVMFLY